MKLVVRLAQDVMVPTELDLCTALRAGGAGGARSRSESRAIEKRGARRRVRRHGRCLAGAHWVAHGALGLGRTVLAGSARDVGLELATQRTEERVAELLQHRRRGARRELLSYDRVSAPRIDERGRHLRLHLLALGLAALRKRIAEGLRRLRRVVQATFLAHRAARQGQQRRQGAERSAKSVLHFVASRERQHHRNRDGQSARARTRGLPRSGGLWYGLSSLMLG